MRRYPRFQWNHEGPAGFHIADYNYVLCYWYSHLVLSTGNYYLFKWKKWTLRGTHCNYIATAVRVPHVKTTRYLPGTYYWNLLLCNHRYPDIYLHSHISILNTILRSSCDFTTISKVLPDRIAGIAYMYFANGTRTRYLVLEITTCLDGKSWP